MPLVKPHGRDNLLPLLLEGQELVDAKMEAEGLAKVTLSSRETGDLIMMGIGAFTPLTGFMGKADWQGVCDGMQLVDGTFWPIPITFSASRELADGIVVGQKVALVDGESGEVMGSLVVGEKYEIDKAHECSKVFRTTDPKHPGVAKVLDQGEVNLAGEVKVFSEGHFPETYKGVYARPAETRRLFEEKGWKTVAAFQTRNPMHRSHEYLAKLAVEMFDGLIIHMLLGKLKDGDIPADVRTEAIDALVDNYFVKDTCVVAGYPMEMRYAGPREALLHAVFRQNFGCSHLIVGRDHAGVGSYYGPFDAQNIFDEVPEGALLTKPVKIDHTFYCRKCEGMASARTCPHAPEDRLNLSGTLLRKLLSEGGEVPAQFSRPEVLEILKKYYAGLDEKVEINLHSHSGK
ncbi:MAG TPA: sulfate adenylyltransferase [Nitrospirota bacterium]|jgi:sulfate adenylyltransferase